MFMMRPHIRKVVTLRVTSIVPSFTYLCEMTEERPLGASACVAGRGLRRYCSIPTSYGPLLQW